MGSRALLRLALLFACMEDVKAESLARELKLRSEKEGLGIAKFSGNSIITVIDLDGTGRRRELVVPGLDYVYDIEPRSQVILASNKGLLNALRKDGLAAVMTGSFALFSLDGHETRPTGLLTWPRLAALSPKLDSLAVLSLAEAAGQACLLYGPLDWSSTRKVFCLDLGNIDLVNYREENFSWSPDQNFLVYSMEGRIYIFEISSRTTRSVAEGSDPCWSPDGRAIAYRSKNRDLMLYMVSTGRTDQLTKLYAVVGFPRWSPDSEYLLFTQSNLLLALRDLHTLPTTEFMVIRVSDGAVAPVYTPGMDMDNRRFYWVRTGVRRGPVR